MTNPPLPYDPRLAALDDAVEAALAGSPPPAAPAGAIAATAAGLAGVAHALGGAPSLDPARRAAIAARLVELAAAPDAAGDGSSVPAVDPAAPPSASERRDGTGPTTRRGRDAAAIAGVLVLALVGGALWRGRAVDGGDALRRPPSDAVPDGAAAGAGAPGGFTSGGGDPSRSAPGHTSPAATPARRGEEAARAAADGSAAAGRPATTATATAARRPVVAGAAAARAAAGDGASAVRSTPPGAAGPNDPSTRTPDDPPTPAPPSGGRSGRDDPATAAPATPAASATPPAAAAHPCAYLVQPSALVARVVDEGGRPIEGALVALFAVGITDFASIGTTLADGCAAVEQAAGRFDVHAQAAGHAARWYPGVPDRAAAVAVALEDGVGRPPIDLVLPASEPATPTAAPPPATASPTGAPSAAPSPATTPALTGWLPATPPTSTQAPPATATTPPLAAAASAGVRSEALASGERASHPGWSPAASSGAANGLSKPAADAAGRFDAPTGAARPALPSDAARGAAVDAADEAEASPAALRERLAALAAFDQDGGTVTGVAVAEDATFAVVGARVVGWRDGAGEAPTVWSPVLPDVPEAIAVDGGRLVAAVPGDDEGPASVWIWDAAHTAGALPLLGACALEGSSARRIVGVAADATWIAVRTEVGLSVIDAKRAAAPREVGFLALPEPPPGRAASAVALLDGGAYAVVAGRGGPWVVDLREPSAPRPVGVAGAVGAVGVAAGRDALVVAVAADDGAGAVPGSDPEAIWSVHTYDVRVPARAQHLASLPLTGGSAARGAGAPAPALAVHGTTAVVADSAGGWRIDLRDPARPVVVERHTRPDGAGAGVGAAADAVAAAIEPDGGAVRLAQGRLGLARAAWRDGDAGWTATAGLVPPMAHWTRSADGGAGWGAAGAAGIVSFAMDAGRGGPPSARRLGAVADAADADGVAAVGATVFALTQQAGLVAIDARDARAPRRLAVPDALAGLRGGQGPVQMAVVGHRLYVPGADGAIHAIEAADGRTPRWLGRRAVTADGPSRLVALAAADDALVALASDGRRSRVHMLPWTDDDPLPAPGPVIDLARPYRRLLVAGDDVVLSGDRAAPGLAAFERRDPAPAPIEVPGLAAGDVGRLDLPGGVRRLLVADDDYLTAIDLDALADPARRVSGRSVRLPHGRRADDGTVDVRIVGDDVVVGRGEAGLLWRPHGVIALPAPPAAATPIGDLAARFAYRAFLPQVRNGAAGCAAATRRHDVLALDASTASAAWLGGAGAAGLAGLGPGAAAWLEAVGVGRAPGASASVIGWGAQADLWASGNDLTALLAPLPAARPSTGRRIDAALAGAAVQLALHGDPTRSPRHGHVVVVAAGGWDAGVHGAAVAQAAALRRAGWTVAAVAAGPADDGDLRRQLGELTGEPRAVQPAAHPADLPGALRAAAAWGDRCR